MGKKSDVVWLVEPGTREIPRKTIEEARELLAQGKGYVRHVIRAWLERKLVRWREYEFQPERLGIEVYIDGKYDRSIEGLKWPSTNLQSKTRGSSAG